MSCSKSLQLKNRSTIMIIQKRMTVRIIYCVAEGSREMVRARRREKLQVNHKSHEAIVVR